jgi:uncharacterized BrkB/YihY/UPF0761 family membrane protein
MRTQRRYCDYDCYHQNEFVTLMMEWSVPGLTATQATENIAVAARNAGAVLAVLGAVSCWSSTLQMWTLSRALIDAFWGAHDLTMIEGGDG